MNPKLDSIRCRVESGNVTVSRGLNRGETKFVWKNDLLYRQFAKGNKVLLLWFLTVTCSCCPYLYFGSAIMLVTYFSKFVQAVYRECLS